MSNMYTALHINSLHDYNFIGTNFPKAFYSVVGAVIIGVLQNSAIILGGGTQFVFIISRANLFANVIARRTKLPANLRHYVAFGNAYQILVKF